MNWNETISGIYLIVFASMALSLIAIATFAILHYKENRKTKQLQQQLDYEISMRGKRFTLDGKYTEEEKGLEDCTDHNDEQATPQYIFHLKKE